MRRGSHPPAQRPAPPPAAVLAQRLGGGGELLTAFDSGAGELLVRLVPARIAPDLRL